MGAGCCQKSNEFDSISEIKIMHITESAAKLAVPSENGTPNRKSDNTNNGFHDYIAKITHIQAWYRGYHYRHKKGIKAKKPVRIEKIMSTTAEK